MVLSGYMLLCGCQENVDNEDSAPPLLPMCRLEVVHSILVVYERSQSRKIDWRNSENPAGEADC